jgi:endonuclease/exonuclease/phosphatase family metal-dependent hydrolase
LGNIIFYNKAKFHMVDRYAFWLSDTPDKPSATWGNKEPRNCVVVELLDNFTFNNISVMCTHLDHTSAEVRKRSAQLIVSKGFLLYNYMVWYLAGDFNASVDDPEMQLLSRCRFFHFPKDVATTFNGFRGNKKSVIDYIFTNMDYHNQTVVTDGYGVPYLSDHYPIIVNP